MFKFFVALSLLVGSSQGLSNWKLKPETGHEEGGSMCPYADGSIVFEREESDDQGTQGDLTIKCPHDGVAPCYTTTIAANAAKKEIALADASSCKINTGRECMATATITGQQTVERAFTVGFKQHGGGPGLKIWPCGAESDPSNTYTNENGDQVNENDEVVNQDGINCGEADELGKVGSIKAGKEFVLTNLHMTAEIPFFDLLLRECTASSDPWLFWEEVGRTDKGGNSLPNALHRIYPTSTTNELNTTSVVDKKPGVNSNSCLGAFDGQLRGLFTIGDDHRGCKFKVVKEEVKGGDSIAEAQGDPQLTAATVSIMGGKVMVHTGKGHPDLSEAEGAARNAPQPGILPNIRVYVSTNRGFTWQKSPDIIAWTDAAKNSGIDAAATSSDNTRNMAMVRFVDGGPNEVYWRIIKGQ